MKIQFAKIQGKEELDYKLELNEPLIIESASIKSINSAYGTIDLEKAGDVFIFRFNIRAHLTVYSSISGEPFDYEEEIEDTIYYTPKESLKSNDVFYMEKDFIDVDEEVISLIISEVPIQLHKENEEYPSGENYRVISEDDYYNEKSKNTPFANLFDDEDEK